MDWWEELYDIMHSEGEIWYPVDEMQRISTVEVDFLLDALNLDKGARILDLGCGSGRHCIQFAAKGYDVTGIDLSEKLIEKALSNAQEEAVEAEFKVRDMRKLEYKDEFDAAVMMDVTFGIFDDEENEKLIGTIFETLKPGGQLFLSVFNPYYWATHVQTTHLGGEEEEIIRKYSFNHMKGRVEDAQIYINVNKGVRRVHPVQSLRAYTVPEIRQMGRKAGFTTFVVYGDRGDFMPTTSVPFNPAKSLGLYVKIRK